MRKVEFLDTSLRDGEQTPGVCSPSRRLVSKNSTLRIGSPHFYIVDIKKNISLGQPSEMFLPAW